MDRLLEHAVNHPFLVGGVVLLLGAVVAYEFMQSRRRGVDVSPLEAVALINAGAQPVDLRAAAQYEKGHLLEARNVPLADLDQHAASLQKLGRTLLLYCETGMSARRAVAQFKARGLVDVRNLHGGLAAWRQENLPVVTGRKQRRQDSR